MPATHSLADPFCPNFLTTQPRPCDSARGVDGERAFCLGTDRGVNQYTNVTLGSLKTPSAPCLGYPKAKKTMVVITRDREIEMRLGVMAQLNH